MTLNIQRFQKRPVEVQAVQTPTWAKNYYDGMLTYIDTVHDVAQWCEGVAQWASDGSLVVAIHTLEGVMEASPGDWIIKEPFATEDRQFYPCKASMFEQTYEYVGDVSHPDQPAIPGI